MKDINYVSISAFAKENEQGVELNTSKQFRGDNALDEALLFLNNLKINNE
jgi:hypothetical protein